MKNGTIGRFDINLDRRVFIGSTVLVLPFIVTGIISPELLGTWSSSALTLIYRVFGWLFLSSVNIIVLICLLLALSPFGSLRLGKDDEKPEFSRFSWFAMLFSAGMGIGLVFWSIAEPLYHFSAPPIGQAGTAEAARLALTIFFYHWGIHAWAVYVAVGLPLAFFQFRRGLPGTLSSCFSSRSSTKGIPGTSSRQLPPFFSVLVDVLSVWATIMGVVTSLGLGAMQISKGMSISYGISENIHHVGLIILVITVLFLISAVSGVNRGIKYLSQFNVLLMALLFMVFLFFGPSFYLVSAFFRALSDYLQAIIPLSSTFVLFGNQQWTNDWTIFYWAWWIAWAPFVGAFIAKISRGRTIREFILCIMILPAMVSFLFTTALGGTALHMQLIDKIPLVATVGKSIEAALFETLHHLPGFGVTTILANLLIASFFITSADSATMVISTFSSGGRNDSGSRNDKVLILFWGTLLGVLAYVLVNSGGLKALQSASIIGALPFIFIIFGILGNFIRELVRERAHRS